MYRSTFGVLAAHLSKKQATILTGMRRIGKTIAINYLHGSR